MNKELDASLQNISCFKAHADKNKKCMNKKCRYWHENVSNDCVINESQNKTLTLQEIGDLFKITRMRVCQIEKKAIEKIKKGLA